MKWLNKHIGQDSYLGLNRFRIDMYSENWFRFGDGSGGRLHIIFKLSDNVTGNTAYFFADNYDYDRKIAIYANDFLIRCSSGSPGHYPNLIYVAYDINNVIPYDRDRKKTIICKENVIDTYSWIKSIQFEVRND